MNKNYYIFLSQIISAIKGNKQFFISKSSLASWELASVFKKLNIIKKVTEPSPRIIRTMPKLYRPKYKIFWLNDSHSIFNKNKIFCNDTGRSVWSKNKWFFNRIQIMKPSTFHSNIISYKELKDIKPFWNTIYIMQTSKGIITSKEAMQYKVGGIIICIIKL